MAIPSSGPIKFSDIKKEFGGDSDPSLSEYSGDDIIDYPLPPDGQPISFSDFRGLDFDIVRLITENTTFVPSVGKASKIHVFIVGPGGGGGAARAETGGGGFFGIGGTNDGVAVASGGGAGGVAYRSYNVEDIGRIEFEIGVGGAATTLSGENVIDGGNFASSPTRAYVYNKAGTRISYLYAGGGNGGGAARDNRRSGYDDATSPPASGGIGIGGSINITGGSSGKAEVGSSGVASAASGGGAPGFLASHELINSAVDAVGSGAALYGEGAKVSGFLNYPSILATYLTNLGLEPILGSSKTEYDGGKGGTNSGGDGGYGAGGGGAAGIGNGTSVSGKGGDGIAIIVYEIV